MSALSLPVALALLAASAADDPVHNQIQAFLNVIQSGGDFAGSQFKDAVKDADVVRLRGLSACDLSSVKRSAGGSSAIVLFDCPAATGRTSTAVMIMFSSGRAVSIQPMSFVQVPERG